MSGSYELAAVRQLGTFDVAPLKIAFLTAKNAKSAKFFGSLGLGVVSTTRREFFTTVQCGQAVSTTRIFYFFPC